MIRRSSQNSGPRKVRGFSLLELVIVVSIAMIVVAMAIPGIRRTLQYYSLRSGVTSVTGAIQSARYNAIFHGCQYQLVFTAASKSYTVANRNPAAGGTACNGAFGAASAAVPLMGSGVALSSDVTMQFFPNGQITMVPAANPMTITLSYSSSGLVPETITVSPYGRISVYP
jgi:Tfp pilus assembly protein FimT